MANPAYLEMQMICREAAEPWFPGDSVKLGINRAARKLGIGYRRARSFWYGDEVAVRADEADKLRAIRGAMAEAKISRLEAELANLWVIRNEVLGGQNAHVAGVVLGAMAHGSLDAKRSTRGRAGA